MSNPQASKKDPFSAAVAAFGHSQRVSMWLLSILALGLIVMSLFLLIQSEERGLKLNALYGRMNDLERRFGPAKIRLTPPDDGFENGLSAAERQEFYHLAEGSEVYPLDWLRALEDKTTGKPFLADIERFGFLADPYNPDRLPVGLTAAVSRGLEPLGKMVGLNCAACHVGELTYKGKRMRIDGAPNLFNARQFFAGLVESALATAEDPAKLLAFLFRLRDDRTDQKAASNSKIRQSARKLLAKLVEKNADLINDALGPLVKKLLDDEKALPPVEFDKLLAEVKKDGSGFRSSLLKGFNADVKPTIAKSKLIEFIDQEADREGSLLHTLEEAFIAVRLLRSRAEFLKRLGPVGQDERTDWGPGRVDAFGSARTFLFDPSYKPRFGISYPHLWGMGQFGWFHYDNNTTSILERNFGQALGVGAVYDKETFASTLRPMNLHRLEELARKITPPPWPVKLLGKIDQESVKRGAELYAAHCVKCHPIVKWGEPIPELLYDLKEIGTDLERATSFAAKLPDGQPFVAAIDTAMKKIAAKAMTELTAEERAVFAKDAKAVWRAPGKYAGRPLVSIWATAPYLHNGSVPTLYDLLLPAKDRPKQFHLGNREYDPVKLGYVTDPQPRAVLFDTTQDGNSNVGHEYGTSLDVKERTDLLEYLKAR